MITKHLSIYALLLFISCNVLIVYSFTQTVQRTKQQGNDNLISTTLNLLWPFSNITNSSDFPFSSTFGPRLQASNSYSYDFHRGIDIPKPNRTKLYAVASGNIFRSRVLNGDRYIALRVELPLSIKNIVGQKYIYAIYRHLNESVVGEGSNVTAGDHIAYSGEDIDSGFDHLHFDLAVGQTYETNNTHPLIYLNYNDTQTPNISNPNPNYFDSTANKLNVTTTVAESELDLVGIRVQVSFNSNSFNVSADLDFPTINHITLNKTQLDNRTQTLSNGVIVTIYPESHNIQNIKCVVHFEFDFSQVMTQINRINQYEFNITAYDARGGYERVTITGV